MRKYIITLFALLALALQLDAQDARQRTTQTIVSDVLAAMPAKNAAILQENMADIANSAPKSVEMLGVMLEPAVKAKNNRVEYAISGVVSYASMNPSVKEAVKEGLEAAYAAQLDSDAKAFLQSQIRLLGVAPAPVEVAPRTVLSEKAVLKAIRSKDRSTRVRALNDAPAGDAFAAKLVKASKAKGAEADILYWLAENGKTSQLPYVLKQVDGNFSDDAIRAAALLGGDAAATKLCSLLSTDKAPKAVAALKYFKGDIAPALIAAADKADANTLRNVMEVASARHITPLMKKAAEAGCYTELKGLVSAGDAPYVASLLDNAAHVDVPALQAAYAKAVSYSGDTFADVMKTIDGAKNPSRFYNALAGTGKAQSVDYLARRYWEGRRALTALSSVNDPLASEVMLDASRTDESYLPQYLKLVAKGKDNLSSKAAKYTTAMEIAKSVPMKKKVLESMSTVAIPEMLAEVDKYLDDSSLKRNAALAAHKIMVTAPTLIDNSELKRVSGRVAKVLNSTGHVDDGYAVMELMKVVDAQQVMPTSELTAEEKAQGFEVLFDGTNMDKWVDGAVGYQCVNGVINVTANYGGAGNLYTKGEYKDFIYRFEFRFLEGGVNNGVGVRTPANGCDAAYDAMCEVQILDHDDPIYVGLQDYQVHGSAYGIIPAKRLKHKPVGEWSCEEIEVRGMHVKVTVNGEVILDGDLREACQGHNVAPDGGKVNPFTVDHKNHPGMFNEKGHISFCGHGNGLQFRNIRVLDLSK